ncbi:hypothetical protein ACFYOD_02210 [Streptomyces sp. NPDC006703]|uniref:hypothetical protein n=1 Tax=Streptomyces sp. NPDC006703 TaxID=3364759 RepID=UPI003691A20A
MASDHSPSQDEQIPIPPGDEPRVALLRAVATYRPMHEVASLVHLLNQAGEHPGPGDQALRLAVVSRSLNEVHQLISLLHEPPSTPEDAETALRAAAMERPIEDVVALITSFGPDGSAPLPQTAQTAEEPEATAPSVVPATAAAPEPTAPSVPVAAAAAVPEAPAPSIPVAAEAPEAPVPVVPTAAPTPTPTATPTAEPAGITPSALAAALTGERAAAAPPVPSTPPAGSPSAPEAVVVARMEALGPSSVWTPVRSVLRWPAAVVLLVIGAIHVPTDILDLRAGDPAAGVSMIIAAACLTLACLLPLHDAVWAWMVGAAAALGTVVIHSVTTALNSVHLLRGSLGSTFTGATKLTVLCAVIAVALAAAALTRKPRVSTAKEA